MNCERMRDHLADYLAGVATAAVQQEVEAHLAACGACRADIAMWREMEKLPVPEPSDALRRRVNRMIDDWADAEPAVRPVRHNRTLDHFYRPALAAAAALVLVAVGYFAGLASGRGAHAEVASMRNELREMRAMVALSLLEQQSAIERLRGVNWSASLEPSNAEVARALVQTVRYDSSVNVRLAAVEALRGYAQTDDSLRERLIEATADDRQAPLVQIALIDLLVELQERRAAPYLEKLRTDLNTDDSVRQRASWGLEKLG